MPASRIAVDRLTVASFDAGQTTRGVLTVPIGLGGEAELPLLAARGPRPGPTALLAAGIHGDEFEGIAALGRLVRGLDPTTLTGTVIALPVCNPFAFHAQRRASPDTLDGANLAREFPGDPGGTPTQRLAAALMSAATRLLGPDDLVVDLHSAGTRYRYLTLVGYRDFGNPAAAASQRAARHFGDLGQRLWSIWPHRSMFNSETTLAGIPTVATEAPGQGRCHARDVARYVTGVTNLLRHRGIAPGPVPEPDPRPAGVPTELHAAADGLFVAHAEAGDTVADGALIAEITDPSGEILAAVTAPHDGVLWALRTFGSVYQGEYVVWVGPPE